VVDWKGFKMGVEEKRKREGKVSREEELEIGLGLMYAMKG
jgi:hypothetical protein